MTLTRASPKLHVDSGNHSWSPTRTVSVDNLPDEVLLEIFDRYRQSFRGQPNFEEVWNNKNGWFKLAHVCRNWRSVVLASPSRLQLRIYFADKTPTRAAVLKRLSHLPIVVDYRKVTWNASAPKRLISALRYPDRVCRIAIVGSHGIDRKVFEALDAPFPILESLEIRHLYNIEPIITTSFVTSAQSLRHLYLGPTYLTSLLPLLSVTRALVDLTLGIDTVSSPDNGASLLTYLQNMPRLRNLQVFTQFYYSGEMPSTTTTAVLVELTCFHFFGLCAQIEWLVAGLAIPSIRELHISATDLTHLFHLSDTTISHALHMPYLSKFIRAAGIFFFAARIASLGPNLTTTLFSRPHSMDDTPSKIVTLQTSINVYLGSELSLMLTTVEDIFLSDSAPHEMIHAPLGKLFEEFRNVKVLRLQHGLEAEVSDILRKPIVNPPPPQEEINPDATIPLGMPINSNRNNFNLDILPSLEAIAVYANPDTLIDDEERASVLESFGPFATARQEVGRTVRVFWSTDGEVPRYFNACTWKP